MSGYLSRLAQRAMHIAPMVHANASLPFFPPPEPALVAETATVPVDGPSLPDHRPAPNPEPSPREVPRPELSVPPTQHDDARTIVSPEQSPAPRPPATERPVLQTTIPAPMHFERQDAPSTPATVAPAKVSLTEPAAAGTIQHRTGASPSPTAPVRPTHPAPTIRPVVRSVVTPAHPTAPSQPDVYIHIGRIELTAVPEAAPPRRKAEAGKKPMSLDQYLERRSTPKR